MAVLSLLSLIDCEASWSPEVGLQKEIGTVDAVENALRQRYSRIRRALSMLSYQDIGPASMLSRA